MKKKLPEKERQLELCDVLTRIEVVIHSVDVLGGKVDELLKRTAPDETKKLPSEVTGAAFGRRSCANMPIRSYPPDTHIIHPDLGTL